MFALDEAAHLINKHEKEIVDIIRKAYNQGVEHGKILKFDGDYYALEITSINGIKPEGIRKALFFNTKEEMIHALSAYETQGQIRYNTYMMKKV